MWSDDTSDKNSNDLMMVYAGKTLLFTYDERLSSKTLSVNCIDELRTSGSIDSTSSLKVRSTVNVTDVWHWLIYNVESGAQLVLWWVTARETSAIVLLYYLNEHPPVGHFKILKQTCHSAKSNEECIVNLRLTKTWFVDLKVVNGCVWESEWNILVMFRNKIL